MGRGGGGCTYRRTYVRTDKFPLCSTGLCSLRGRCLASFYINSHTQVLPLGNLLRYGRGWIRGMNELIRTRESWSIAKRADHMPKKADSKPCSFEAFEVWEAWFWVGWSGIRVKFQKIIYSSLLHKCTKLEGFLTIRGLSLKIKPCRQHYGLPMAMKKSLW